jgi:SAM-dependent methyltransferase
VLPVLVGAVQGALERGSVVSALPIQPLLCISSTTPEALSETTEDAIADFWQSHPCGDHLAGGLEDRFRGDPGAFFDTYDADRYRLERHIPRCLDELDVRGKRVLEIGLGQGAESEGLIRRGARWIGMDVTEEAVRRVSLRLELAGLPYEGVTRGSATAIPLPDQSVDLVFSHGVLHHVPDIAAAQSEIARVLRPGGRLVAMVYSRRSLNYFVSIAVVRRAALLLAWPIRSRVRKSLLGAHLRNAERQGLWPYLRLKRFTHANTDGPLNPFSRVYDVAALRQDFPNFNLIGTRKEFMHAPPLPVHQLPGARLMGWHLWAEFEVKTH